jgi:two-component system CheB/CheR fusion protein
VDRFFFVAVEGAGPRASADSLRHGVGRRARHAGHQERGGITIAQSPESAKYDGMPRQPSRRAWWIWCWRRRTSAPAVGAAATRARAIPDDAWPADQPVSEGELREVFDILRPVSGVDFRHYKLPTIKRRLFRRMALHHLSEVAQYVRLLREDQAEVRSLYNDLLIHVTRFFREPESFEAMATDVFPAIVQGRGPNRPIRAWVSGCATGEEAYSLAIALVEYLQANRIDAPVQIFATDVSEAAVDQARSGVFSASIEADVNPERLRKFFTRNDGGYRVTKMIRDLCVFARGKACAGRPSRARDCSCESESESHGAAEEAALRFPLRAQSDRLSRPRSGRDGRIADTALFAGRQEEPRAPQESRAGRDVHAPSDGLRRPGREKIPGRSRER